MIHLKENVPKSHSLLPIFLNKQIIFSISYEQLKSSNCEGNALHHGEKRKGMRWTEQKVSRPGLE